MTKEETKKVLLIMINESHRYLKENAEKVIEQLDNAGYNFAQFGDRNTFARIIFEVLMKKEIEEYSTSNYLSSTKKAQANKIKRSIQDDFLTLE